MITANPHIHKTTFIVMAKFGLPFFFLSVYFLMRSLKSDFMSPLSHTHIPSQVKYSADMCFHSYAHIHRYSYLKHFCTFGLLRPQHIKAPPQKKKHKHYRYVYKCLTNSIWFFIAYLCCLLNLYFHCGQNTQIQILLFNPSRLTPQDK